MQVRPYGIQPSNDATLSIQEQFSVGTGRDLWVDPEEGFAPTKPNAPSNFPHLPLSHPLRYAPESPARRFHTGGPGGEIESLAAVFIGANPVNDYISCSRFMGANAVNYQISRSRFVGSNRASELVRTAQKPWGGYTGTHMESVMAGDAGALKYAGIAAMALKFELLKNTINIDKLLKMFGREITLVIYYNSVVYKIYVK